MLPLLGLGQSSPGPINTDSLKSVIDTMPENEEKLVALSNYIYHIQNIDSIRKYAMEGADMALRLQNGTYEANNYRFLGWTYTVTAQMDSALMFYYKAANVFDSIEHAKGLALTYIGISELEEMNNHIPQAIDYAMTAINLSEQTQDSTLIAVSLHRMAVIYNQLGAHQESLKFSDKALEINKETRDTMQIGNNLREKASAMMTMENDTTAAMLTKDYLLTARQMYTITDDIYDLIDTDHLLCEAYLNLAKMDTTYRQMYLDSTMYFYKDGKRICHQMGQPYFEALLDIALIKYLITTNRTQDAKRKLDSLKTISITDRELDVDFMETEYLLLKSIGKYNQALVLRKKIDRSNHQTAIKEYDVRLTRINSDNEFYAKIKQREKEKQIREQQLELDRQYHAYIIQISKILLAIILIVALVVMMQYISKQKTNKQLQAQKKDILEKNEVLKYQNEEIINQHDQIMDQTSKIKEQTDVLMKANLRTLNNLEAAERIQTALMPSLDKMKRIFGDVLIYWKPFNIVSGDFYWAAEVMGYKFVAVADCTGHGVPGALMSTLGLSALNETASSMKKSMKLLTAAETLKILRRKIETAISCEATRYEDSVNDGMDIALSIISPDEKTLEFAGAKRPLWLARNGEITIYKGDTITVGPNTMGENKPEFTNNVIKLQPNDCIYMFSDGITDQLGPIVNGIRKKFQSGRLKKILESIHAENLDIQWFTIDTKLQEWTGPEMTQTDDILLMGIKIGGISRWIINN